MDAGKNKAKYLSYKEAWKRIKAATSAGFYFEVVALSESIISDRILSYLHWKNSNTKSGIKTSFSKLISEWKKLAEMSLPKYGKTDLATAVDRWRDERNLVVHGLTKSMPGVPTNPVGPFIDRAEKAAKDGASLARAVSAWFAKEKKPQITAPQRTRLSQKDKIALKPPKKRSGNRR